MQPGGETPRASVIWSFVTILLLLLGVGTSRLPGAKAVWDVGGGAFERRASQDARNDGYYEELLDAGEQRGRGGWFTTPSETAPADWPRLHETDGVLWDEPFQRFRLRPGANESYKGAPLGVNDLGLRDRPASIERAPGVRRVAMVGASILMGSGVPVDLTFENQVEDAVASGVLGDRGPVEFLNFGVAGYRIDQLADVVLTRLEAFEPDVVVMVLNDLALNPNWSRHIAWLLQEDRDLRYDFIRRAVDLAGVDGDDEPRVVSARLASQRDAVIEGSLRAARAWCEARDIPLVLLSLAQPSRTTTFPERLDGVRPLIGRLGLEMLEIADAFDGHPDPESLWLEPWDRHPTAEGHRIMAERLLDELESRPDLADQVLGPARSGTDGARDG